MTLRVLTLLLCLLAAAPAAADGWFPKINGRGEIASGFGVMITVDGRGIEQGWGPNWVDDDTIAYTAGNINRVVLYNVRTNVRTPTDANYNFMAAGSGMWLGSLAAADFPVERWVGTAKVFRVAQAGIPIVAPTSGRWGYVEPYQANNKNIWLDGEGVVASGVITQAFLTDRGLIYQHATGMYTRQTFVRRLGGAVQDVSISNWEGPVGCDGPDDIYVLSTTQVGLALRKAGAQAGWYWRGEHFYPSCRFVGGQMLVAFSDRAGNGGTYRFGLDRPADIHYADAVKAGDCVGGMTPHGACPEPTPPVTPQCRNGADDDGDGLVDAGDPGCKSTDDNDESPKHEKEPPPPPPPPPPPAALSCDGVPSPGACEIFKATIATRPSTAWREAFHAGELGLWARGLGHQKNSGGEPRGRVFLPHAGCPNAAPRPGEERWGVRQEEACWDQLGRIADVVNFEGDGGWVWVERGRPPYQPWDGGTDPVDPDPDPEEPPDDGKDARIAALEAEVARLTVALADTQPEITELTALVEEMRERLVATQQELEALKAAPIRCEAKVPAWVRQLGVKVGCTILR